MGNPLHPDWNKFTDNGRMNVWVGEQLRLLDRLIDDAKGENRAYISGVRAGIRILQDEWLKDGFVASQEGQPK